MPHLLYNVDKNEFIWVNHFYEAEKIEDETRPVWFDDADGNSRMVSIKTSKKTEIEYMLKHHPNQFYICAQPWIKDGVKWSQ